MPRDIKRIQTLAEPPNDGWAKDKSGVHVWLVLRKAYSSVRDYALKDIASLGLGLSDFAILELLLHRGATPVNEIGGKVLLSSGSMTIAVDRLAARKLVERRTSEEDRRTRVVHLTPAGRKLIESAFAAHAESLNRLGEVLTARERSRTIRLLKKLGRAAEAGSREDR